MIWLLLLGLQEAQGSCLLDNNQKHLIEDNLYFRKDTSVGFCYSYFIGDSLAATGTFCFPSLLVAGFPKCGTSFMFKTLSTHPAIISTQRKELCLEGVKSETWSRFITFLPNETHSSEKYVMSGCLHFGANVNAMKQLCATGIKVVYLVRDVADMLWAAYNFWCINGHDVDCFPGKHTTSLNKRDPIHFDQLIRAGLPMGGGMSLDSEGLCFKSELRDALRVYGAHNVLVLRSEDMLNPQKKVESLKRVMLFLDLQSGVSDAWVKEQGEQLVRVNAGASHLTKGEKTIHSISPHSTLTGRYESSGNLPMLPSTRQVIYQRWWHECKWLDEHFGIRYTACWPLSEI
jgi:hypothetical protein